MTNSHNITTREQAADMAEAHAEGYHLDLPREGCPECEGRPLRSYPTAAEAEQMLSDRENASHPDECGHDFGRNAR